MEQGPAFMYFNQDKKKVCMRIVRDTIVAAISLFRSTNMAAVTSGETKNTKLLYVRVLTKVYLLTREISSIHCEGEKVRVFNIIVHNHPYFA